jgi:hypothetical protein
MLRVFIKAIVLSLVINFIALASGIDISTALMTFNTWGLVGHGRARLIYRSDFSSDLSSGQLPVEALLAAHQLSHATKAVDEFRVIFLGDSSVIEWNLADNATTAGQLTARNITINGKRLVVYNLGYPNPSLPRDLILLDAALQYKPDLVVWFTTAATYDNSSNFSTIIGPFLKLNRTRLQKLTTTFGLQNWFIAHMTDDPMWMNWIAARDANAVPSWIKSLTYPFVINVLDSNERTIFQRPIPKQAIYASGRVGFDPQPNDSWRFLLAGNRLAASVGAPMLVVNEPILLDTRTNSDINYDELYERTFYDQYRQDLDIYTQNNNLWYMDAWNTIPNKYFTDTALHADAAGFSFLVDKLSTEIQTQFNSHCSFNMNCPLPNINK